jgi:TolB-like protein
MHFTRARLLPFSTTRRGGELRNRLLCGLGWPGLAIGLVIVAVGLAASLAYAEPASLKLAIGPFSAPAEDAGLRQAGARLPDLLAVELSHESRFQLVERDKVAAIWQELHLSATGRTTAETVSQLGRVLACDWLVTGTLVPSGTRTQVWVKVVDIKSSVVLDLEALPFNANNMSAALSGIAAFLTRAGSSAHQRQFITLGRFTDLSISYTREDWAPRLRALLEHHFHAAGVGVVERDAVTPIFEEFQFEQAGLTGSATNRVKLQPAFWVVDGGCKWVRDTEDKVSVALRIQKMGEKEQVVRFTKLPGAELESAVIAAVQAALAHTNQIAAGLAASSESSFHTDRGMEGAMRQAPITPSRYPANFEGRGTGVQPDSRVRGFGTPPDPEERAKREDNRRATLESYQKAILLNPTNLTAKYMLGYGLLGDHDMAQRERGKTLLNEIAASKDADLGKKAQYWLNNADMFITRYGGSGAPPAIGANPRSTKATGTVPTTARAQANLPPTNGLLQLPMPRSFGQGHFHNLTAQAVDWQPSPDPATPQAAKGHNILLTACGTNLYRFRPGNETKEKVALPLALEHPVRTIACDTNATWLGTEGGGLVRLSKTGQPPRVFTEKDGLIMPSIVASCLCGDRLWLGFGFRESGGLGCLDAATGKFTGFMPGIGLFKSSGESADGPPDCAVNAIATLDGKTLWIASWRALHQFEVPAQKWTRSLPFGPTCLSINSNYVAAACPTGGVMVCRLPAGLWRKIDLSPSYSHNRIDSLRADLYDTRLLWVGSLSMLTLIDMEACKPIAAYDLSNAGFRRVCNILVNTDVVLFVAADTYFAGDDLCLEYWFDKPAFCKNLPFSDAAAPRKLMSSR